MCKSACSWANIGLFSSLPLLIDHSSLHLMLKKIRLGLHAFYTMENPRLAVKSEVKDDSDIDMDNIAASSQMDEDLYEDAGDLDFAQAQPATFLTRLPKYLWKFLSTTKGDQEGKVGTIRLDGTLDHPRRVRMLLLL